MGKPEHFRVHVEIYFTLSYPGPGYSNAALTDLWKDFKVHLKQDAEVEPQAIDGEPIYSEGDDGPIGIIGAAIEAEYDVGKIDSGALTTPRS